MCQPEDSALSSLMVSQVDRGFDNWDHGLSSTRILEHLKVTGPRLLIKLAYSWASDHPWCSLRINLGSFNLRFWKPSNILYCLSVISIGRTWSLQSQFISLFVGILWMWNALRWGFFCDIEILDRRFPKPAEWMQLRCPCGEALFDEAHT